MKVKIITFSLAVLMAWGGFTTEAMAIPGLFGSSLSENTTGAADSVFLGAPSGSTSFGDGGTLWLGIGGQVVTYDFGLSTVDDGTGQDFNVYEVAFGIVEFTRIDVSVSANGSDFFSVSASESAVVRIDGDSAHLLDTFARSYDIFGTGLSFARYIRIDGNGSSLPSGCCKDFDLDAVGAINFTTPLPGGGPGGGPGAAPVPEPGTLILMGTGLIGLFGYNIRRRKQMKK